MLRYSEETSESSELTTCSVLCWALGMSGSKELCCGCGEAAAGCWLGGISVCAEPEASLIALKSVRQSKKESSSPGCFLFAFCAPLPSNLELGRWQLSL